MGDGGEAADAAEFSRLVSDIRANLKAVTDRVHVIRISEWVDKLHEAAPAPPWRRSRNLYAKYLRAVTAELVASQPAIAAAPPPKAVDVFPPPFDKRPPSSPIRTLDLHTVNLIHAAHAALEGDKAAGRRVSVSLKTRSPSRTSTANRPKPPKLSPNVKNRRRTPQQPQRVPSPSPVRRRLPPRRLSPNAHLIQTHVPAPATPRSILRNRSRTSVAPESRSPSPSPPPVPSVPSVPVENSEDDVDDDSSGASDGSVDRSQPSSIGNTSSRPARNVSFRTNPPSGDARADYALEHAARIALDAELRIARDKVGELSMALESTREANEATLNATRVEAEDIKKDLRTRLDAALESNLVQQELLEGLQAALSSEQEARRKTEGELEEALSRGTMAEGALAAANAALSLGKEVEEAQMENIAKLDDALDETEERLQAATKHWTGASVAVLGHLSELYTTLDHLVAQAPGHGTGFPPRPVAPTPAQGEDPTAAMTTAVVELAKYAQGTTIALKDALNAAQKPPMVPVSTQTEAEPGLSITTAGTQTEPLPSPQVGLQQAASSASLAATNNVVGGGVDPSAANQTIDDLRAMLKESEAVIASLKAGGNPPALSSGITGGSPSNHGVAFADSNPGSMEPGQQPHQQGPPPTLARSASGISALSAWPELVVGTEGNAEAKVLALEAALAESQEANATLIEELQRSGRGAADAAALSRLQTTVEDLSHRLAESEAKAAASEVSLREQLRLANQDAAAARAQAMESVKKRLDAGPTEAERSLLEAEAKLSGQSQYISLLESQLRDEELRQPSSARSTRQAEAARQAESDFLESLSKFQEALAYETAENEARAARLAGAMSPPSRKKPGSN